MVASPDDHSTREEERRTLNRLSGTVIEAAITVHKTFGPGLLESVYESALEIELKERGLFVESQVDVPARYRGHPLGLAFRADLLVERCLLIELKAKQALIDADLAQTATYLKLLDYRLALILNFSAINLTAGLKRVVNDF